MYWKHNGNSSQIDVILCKEVSNYFVTERIWLLCV